MWNTAFRRFNYRFEHLHLQCSRYTTARFFALEHLLLGCWNWARWCRLSSLPTACFKTLGTEESKRVRRKNNLVCIWDVFRQKRTFVHVNNNITWYWLRLLRLCHLCNTPPPSPTPVDMTFRTQLVRNISQCPLGYVLHCSGRYDVLQDITTSWLNRKSPNILGNYTVGSKYDFSRTCRST